MKLITVDIGNTHKTVAEYDSDYHLVKVFPFSDYIQSADDYILISQVGKKSELNPNFEIKKLRSETFFVDMPVKYSMHLGEDRLCASYALYKKEELLSTKKKILIVDAGTFITCDFVSQDGFLGGYILPGLFRLLEAYSKSAQLPLLALSEVINVKPELPQTTDEAITKAICLLIKSSILEMINVQKPDQVFFTGGDAQKIMDLLKPSSLIPFDLSPHLVHLGLSKIHQFHLNQVES